MTQNLLRRRSTWIVLLISLVLNLGFIATRGGWTSDLGGDPDEAAHAVTSLMVRDYLAEGWGKSPLAFANQYYADFPKVALGHYPPGFYLVAGLWLLPWASVQSLLILQSLLAAGLAALTYRVASKLMSMPAAFIAGFLISLLPVCLKQNQLIMSDTLMVLLSVLAAVSWKDYLNRPSLRRVAGFGLLATAAILTKGSAMALCVIPPLTTMLCGRWSLLKKMSWWFSAVPVALVAGPWMLYSSKITAEGMIHVPLREFVPAALAFYAHELPRTIGILLTVLAVAGIALLLKTSRSHRRDSALSAAVVCMLAGTGLIILLIPAGLESRYLLPALPALLVGAMLAADRVCQRLRPYRAVGLAAILTVGIGENAKIPSKEVHGFGSAVTKSLPNYANNQTTRWLVASDPRGEGAVIAAAAFGCPQRAPSLLRVYRGSKELASSDWLGRGYQSTFASTAQLLEKLDKLQITRVFVDLSVPPERQQPHERHLLSAMQSAEGRWRLDFEQPVTRRPGETGVLHVYQRTLPAPTNAQN
ncbi:glycosyltransferase family 39 protein [Prosthecobacter sp.]|uniref:ArnT family glycosyltransferase n=1 Tax=Prosthecobacter sp. TaxID=1965333 RepID=UPI0024886915|nr:glycosyltransferase family 39 protein [Prosthecobacter sp.]MDI1314438.1 glycosyltransferase family 39 protein [Prosthecobacter sp.]